ncbi:MAG: hypothetical protein ACJ8BC_07175 [Gemmatimonadales bacterium]
MDRLQLAQAWYARVAPRPGEDLDAARSDELERWLAEAVCPVTEDLARNEDFRQLARWPLQHLVAEAATPERQLVDEMDRNLVHLARTLTEVTARPDLLALWQHRGAQTSGATGERDWEVDREQVERVAGRPWRDLVAWEDYLHPCRGLHAARPGEVQPGELDAFDPLTQPALGQPGDYVSRLLWLRLGYWLVPLRRQLGRCLGLLGQRDQQATAAVESLGMSWTALEQRVGALEAICRAGTQARLRDSCAALTQVLAGYGTCPDLDWLGLPAGMVQAQRPLIRLCCRRPLCLPGALERVAAALVDVRPLYQPAPAEDVVALAVSTRALVLRESPRALYWQGQPVEAPWEANPLLWELLWTLASRARRGQAVDRFALSNSDSERAIVDRRSRLGRLLPRSLDERIRSAGRRSYRLELPPEQVALFCVEEEERVREEQG